VYSTVNTVALLAVILCMSILLNSTQVMFCYLTIVTAVAHHILARRATGSTIREHQWFAAAVALASRQAADCL